MYVPAHFAMDPDQALSLLAAAELGELITVDQHSEPQATLLPLVHRPDAGGFGSLVMHLARPNQQWRHQGSALVVLSGPDAYISPLWMPSAQQGTVVPTWNYRTVHVRGTLVTHDDPAWTRQAVDLLTARHEPGGLFGAEDQAALDRQVRAIVGVELVITEVIGKDKLGQNKASGDIAAIAETLEGRADDSPRAQHERLTGQAMREVALPHAQARESLVEQARTRRTDTDQGVSLG